MRDVDSLHERRFEVAYHPAAWGQMFVPRHRAPQVLIYGGACVLGLLLIALGIVAVQHGISTVLTMLLAMAIVVVGGVLIVGAMVLVFLVITGGIDLIVSLPARLLGRRR